MNKLFALAGIIVFVFIGYLLSKDKKNINWKSVCIAFVSQFILTFVMIKTPLWKVVQWVSRGVEWLIAQSQEGINFVFGGLVPEGGFVFFINSLLPIVFISGVVGILFHFGVLQIIVRYIAKFIARFFDVDPLVAVNSCANMFLGQTDSLFISKSYLPKASDSVVFATLVGGMSSIAVTVTGLYASSGAIMEYLIISMPLSILSSLVMCQLIMPTRYTGDEIEVEDGDMGVNVIETAMNYSTAGFKSVVAISVALMLFLSAIFMINNILGLIADGLTIQKILGFVFYPFALLMGTPMSEVGVVSEILATKFATNEAVAYAMPAFASLSLQARTAMSVALAGFAGLGSIGIMIGGYSVIAPSKVKTVAKFGFLSLVTASLVNILSGAVIMLFI